MKATGIIRKVDELGRIVIPKELRRSLRIREGDPSLNTLTVLEQKLHHLYQLWKRLAP